MSRPALARFSNASDPPTYDYDYLIDLLEDLETSSGDDADDDADDDPDAADAAVSCTSMSPLALPW